MNHKIKKLMIILPLVLATLLTTTTTVASITAITAPLAYWQEEQEESFSVTAEPALVGNETLFLGHEIESYLIGQLLSSNLVEFELYENETAVALFKNPSNVLGEGIELRYNHTILPEFGYRFQNGTIIYEPTGTELKIVLDKE